MKTPTNIHAKIAADTGLKRSRVRAEKAERENAELRGKLTRLREMWLDKARFCPLWHAEFKRVLGID